MSSTKITRIRQPTKADFDRLREKFSDTPMELDPSARKKLLEVGLYLGSMAVLSIFFVIYYAFIWTPHKVIPLAKSQL